MNINVQGVFYRRSFLDLTIDVWNFNTEGVLLGDISFSHAEYLLGVQGLGPQSFTKIVSAPNENLAFSTLTHFSNGHWVNMTLYNEIKKILEQVRLQNFTSTFCYVLLIQKIFRDALSKPIPKYELNGVLAVHELVQKIESTEGPTLRLYNSRLKKVYELTNSQCTALSEILTTGFFNTANGTHNLNAAKTINQGEYEFFKLVESVQVGNRGNTSKKINTKLIQRLNLALKDKVQEPTHRTFIIGKLFTLMGWLKGYNPDEHFDADNERAYYYNSLKYAIISR